MANILISPGKYVQGANEMARLCDYAKVYGKKALILITEPCHLVSTLYVFARTN